MMMIIFIIISLLIFILFCARNRGQDSVVGIATSYGLDGPGIEFRWGARFSVPIQTGPGAHPASYTTGTGSFPSVKRPGRGVDHPPPSSAEVKERVGLISLLPLSAFVACYRVNLTPLTSLFVLGIGKRRNPFFYYIRNQTANGALHDVTHRLYRCVLYCQTIIPFHGTRIKWFRCDVRTVRSVHC
jgi:hypothetical protein